MKIGSIISKVKLFFRGGLDGVDGSDYSVRLDHLKRTLPDLFDHKTILYVGASPNRNQLVGDFINAGCIVDLVEVNEENYNLHKRGNLFANCYHSDIREFTSDKKYDVVVFWHGIEHIEKHELPELIARMSLYAGIILFGCPYGRYEQGAAYGNKHEVHVSHWNEHELSEHGLNVSSIGKFNTVKSNLISYLRV